MPSIPADEWENGGYPETHYEPIRGMQTKPYDINFDEGLTARKTKQPFNYIK